MSSKEGMVMNIVEGDTRPLTNDERLARYRMKAGTRITLNYEFQGQEGITTGLTPDECVRRTNSKCESEEWAPIYLKVIKL